MSECAQIVIPVCFILGLVLFIHLSIKREVNTLMAIDGLNEKPTGCEFINSKNEIAMVDIDVNLKSIKFNGHLFMPSHTTRHGLMRFRRGLVNIDLYPTADRFELSGMPYIKDKMDFN